MSYHFTQPCPTCGRHNRIPVELLGRQVACPHCQAEFFGGGEDESSTQAEIEKPLLERVDDILRRSAPYGDAANIGNTIGADR
jgi:DNA-directed RNA polymerase subunit RPC12/RpoP